MKTTTNLEGNINYKMLNMLQYKCELAGINVIVNEESYTSKCDSLVLESVEKHESYLGKRVKRGLFQSSVGKLLNADVNGAIGIARKVTGDEFIKNLISRGHAFCPVKFNIKYLRKTSTCAII